jgi:hypothetical protein
VALAGRDRPKEDILVARRGGVATLPPPTTEGHGVAGKKREKALPQTDKKTNSKPKRPKKTSRGK